MIKNLLELESYFGQSEAVKSLNELIARFGSFEVSEAIQRHDLELRPVPCKIYACLTEQARKNLQSH